MAKANLQQDQFDSTPEMPANDWSLENIPDLNYHNLD